MENTTKHLLRWVGKIPGITVAISLVVFMVGYFRQWAEPVQFSNGFFIAGAIAILLSVTSVLGGHASHLDATVLYTESVIQENPADQTRWRLKDIAERYEFLFLLLVPGLLLIGIAITIGKFF